MSMSALPTAYSDPDRLVPSLSSDRADTARAAKEAQEGAKGKKLSMFAEGDDSPSFWDLLDVVNPLQHIPVVNELYREASGDKIGVGARLAGGTLFGGPIGLVASMVDCGVEESTGTGMGGHMLAMFRDEGDTAPATQPATAIASAAPVPAAAAPAPVPPPVQAAPREAVASLSLPDAPAAQGRSMSFSLDAPVAAAPATPVAATPAAMQQVAEAGKPLPLTAAAPQARFMNMPAARSADIKPVPQITVPVSTSGTRSNVPITGRNSANAAMAVQPDPASVQRAMQAQGITTSGDHPMLPPNQAKAVEVQTSANPDWLSAMSQAMDKYERSGKLNAPAPNTLAIQ